jgi:hypothetical protein
MLRRIQLNEEHIKMHIKLLSEKAMGNLKTGGRRLD